MKPIVAFKMGSGYFFSCFDDYKVKDIDELCIMDTFPDIKTNVLNMKMNGKDVFFYRNMDKYGFISDVRDTKVPMKAGKFLIPEFNEFIGLTIDDLALLKDVFSKMDDKHSYEKIIFNSYLENGGFYLTDKQKERAYEEYKKARVEYTP